MRQVKITEICDIQVGKTPSRSNPLYWGDGSLWLSIADMNQGSVLKSTKETITPKAIKECNCKIVPQNTVLFSFKLSIGKIGITKVPMYTNEAIAAFIIKDPSILDTGFLFYVLKSVDHSIGSNKAVMGKTLNKEQLKKIEIPLPSLEDQKKIVKILDKSDILRQKRKEAIELLDNYLKSVFLEMFGDPINNPNGWKCLSLNEVCNEIYRYPTFYGFKYVEEGIPVIKIGNILKSGIVDSNLSNYDFISKEVNARYPRTIIELYDVLMAVRGDGSTVKRIGLVSDSNIVGANISPNLLRFKTNKNILLPHYLFALITSPQGQSMFEKYITQTAKKTITAKDIKQIAIPIPPLSIQNKFTNIVLETESLKQKMLLQSQELETQFQALMQRSFEASTI